METKWDIVDDVASPTTDSLRKASRRLGIKSLRKAVATTLFAGTLILPAYATSTPVTLAQQDFFVSTGQVDGLVQFGSRFIRPRGDRKTQASSAMDTNIGMSTRRLGENYAKLFRPVEDEDTELTGEYSFL